MRLLKLGGKETTVAASFLLLLLPGFNRPATEAEPKIILMRENEIHICKGEEDKVVVGGGNGIDGEREQEKRRQSGGNARGWRGRER